MVLVIRMKDLNKRLIFLFHRILNHNLFPRYHIAEMYENIIKSKEKCKFIITIHKYKIKVMKLYVYVVLF
jgi:hypothetical protein